MDYNPPSSSVHGILQAIILEWVAIPFSRDLPNPEIRPRCPALQAYSLHSGPPGKSLLLSLSVYLYSEELKTGSQRGSCTPVFIIALFPIASRWKLLKHPLIDEQIRGYTYNGLSFSLKKRGNPVTCYNTGEF